MVERGLEDRNQYNEYGEATMDDRQYQDHFRKTFITDN